MFRFGAPALAALLTAWGTGAAQDAPRPTKDPQASFEPRSAPGAGQKFLEKMAGDWEVSKTFHPRSGDPVRVAGACRQEMIHQGRFLRSEFAFTSGGVTTTGLGLIGFEAEGEKFTSVWTDSRATRMSLRQSQGPFTGEEIVLFGRALGDEGKGPFRSRTVTRLEDGGRRIVHRQFSRDAEGKERLVMELVMTRKADGRPPRP
jgi:hypothetical protein